MTITHVWIDEGCIACGACPMTAPTVFVIPDDVAEAYVMGSARVDGCASPNRRERSPLHLSISATDSETIEEAAHGCPVDVIRFLTAA